MVENSELQTSDWRQVVKFQALAILSRRIAQLPLLQGRSTGEQSTSHPMHQRGDADVEMPVSPMEDPDDWPIDQGRPWGLRLLALVGALAFLMLGISSLLPTFQQPVPRPVPSVPNQAEGRA